MLWLLCRWLRIATFFNHIFLLIVHVQIPQINYLVEQIKMINFLLFSRQVPQSIINDMVTQACLRAAGVFLGTFGFFFCPW